MSWQILLFVFPSSKIYLLFFFFEHELADDVNWYWEDNSTVLFCWNAVQCLKVAQLQSLNIAGELVELITKSKWLLVEKNKEKRIEKTRMKGRLSHGRHRKQGLASSRIVHGSSSIARQACLPLSAILCLLRLLLFTALTLKYIGEWWRFWNLQLLLHYFHCGMKLLKTSIGTGKTIVLFFSAQQLFSVWR